MVSSAKITNSVNKNQEFWINDNGKPLLMKPLNKEEIIELFHTIMVNINTTKSIVQNSIKLMKNN